MLGVEGQSLFINITMLEWHGIEMEQIGGLLADTLKSMPNPRRYLNQRWLGGRQHDLHQMAMGRSMLARIVKHQSHLTGYRRDLIQLLAVAIPRLDHTRVGARDVSLAKSWIMRIINALRLHQVASFVYMQSQGANNNTLYP